MNSLLWLLQLALIWCLVSSSCGEMSIKWPFVKVKRQIIVQQEEKTEGVIEDTDRANGRFCKFNHHCLSGCCVAPLREERHCAPMARIGERCTVGQIKGGFYADFCPCSNNAICEGKKTDSLYKTCI